MVLELSREVEGARGLLQGLREKEAERQAVAAFLEKFLNNFNHLLQRLHLPATGLDQAAATLARLRRDYERHQQAEVEARRLAGDITRLEAQLSRQAETIEELSGQIRKLFQAAAVDHEAEFRQRARDWQRRRDLEDQERHLSAQLKLLAGGEQEALFRDLGRSTREELESRLAGVTARLEELHQRLDRLKDQRGRLQERREVLERSEELGQTLLTEQSLAARLTHLARRWAVLTLALHFLKQGRHRFEAESQPQVLKEAGRFFEELTAGRYRGVVATLEDHRLQAVTRQGSHLPADHLSRGTLEQLYLALRFALVRSYHQQGINLPLVLDDVLVNFDHRRARQAVRLLGEMSASHQILFFTCHRHMVDLIKDALGPAAPAPIMLEDPR
jgi:uncharacterized protein YhaN